MIGSCDAQRRQIASRTKETSMRAASIKWLVGLLVPATLAVGLAACSSGTMQPGGGYTAAAGSYRANRAASSRFAKCRCAAAIPARATAPSSAAAWAPRAAQRSVRPPPIRWSAQWSAACWAPSAAPSPAPPSTAAARPDGGSRSPCRGTTARRSPSRSPTTATSRWVTASPSSPTATASPGPCATPALTGATPDYRPLGAPRPGPGREGG